MTLNSILLKIIFAILTVASVLLINKFFPIEKNVLINLAVVCGLVLLSIYSLVKGLKNPGYGIVYGLILAIGFLIYNIFQMLVNKF